MECSVVGSLGFREMAFGWGTRGKDGARWGVGARWYEEGPMAEEQEAQVTMRIRLGDAELEVSGPQNFVEAKIEEFVARHGGLVARAPGGPPTAQRGDEEAQAKARDLSLAQFYKKAAPKTDVDRVLLVGYYLENAKGLESFTAAEVRAALKGARQTPPKNPNDCINSNVRKGLMMAAGVKEGRAAFVLTTDGEERVAELVGD